MFIVFLLNILKNEVQQLMKRLLHVTHPTYIYCIQNTKYSKK